ncbi:MAG TPA: Rrf2 family transcriptional regulator [Rectinemataceae bacterium]|nr:Rrf2 family transcriptional regulator [Rectinemataceae bacterium]
MITSRSRYGLLLLIDLVDHGTEGPIDIASVARRQNIPEAYLAKLIAPLKSAGIVATLRGPKGGLSLAKPPRSTSMLEIVEALEGGSGFGGGYEEGRKSEAGDKAARTWLALDVVIKKGLAEISLEDASTATALEYHI